MIFFGHADPTSSNETFLRMFGIQLWQGPHWLDDQIISFYYEYLQDVK